MWVYTGQQVNRRQDADRVGHVGTHGHRSKEDVGLKSFLIGHESVQFCLHQTSYIMPDKKLEENLKASGDHIQ
jgi:hypothetical protein